MIGGGGGGAGDSYERQATVLTGVRHGQSTFTRGALVFNDPLYVGQVSLGFLQ